MKEESFSEIDVDRLSPSPYQPRMNFDEQAINELAQSIRETGVLQPIIAAPQGKLQHRDRRAALAGRPEGRLKKVPVIIRNMPKERQMEATVIENVQRTDLNPIELAHHFQKLVDVLGYSQEDIADKVGERPGFRGQYPPSSQPS